ncbi:MAG TPA: hypothetical protein VN688_00795 [Gemmataceae bacterium]|nr:hypothetical protein [Gemmataceae bacterium]
MPVKKHHPSLDAVPAMGFHRLKDVLTTRDYLREYCEFLAPVVGLAAKATKEAAASCLRSAKRLSYLGLKRDKKAALVHPEVQYERAMFERWKSHDGSPESGWHRILDYQIPVKDRRESVMGLKAIDLLAIDHLGLPVIIELKIVRTGKHKGADTPLHALLEAASYACVLQADWPCFKTELAAQTKKIGIEAVLPEKLDRVALVVAGPFEYWTFWNYEARTSIMDARPGFRALVDAFRKEGYPVFFTCVGGSVTQPDSLSAAKADFLAV